MPKQPLANDEQDFVSAFKKWDHIKTLINDSLLSASNAKKLNDYCLNGSLLNDQLEIDKLAIKTSSSSAFYDRIVRIRDAVEELYPIIIDTGKEGYIAWNLGIDTIEYFDRFYSLSHVLEKIGDVVKQFGVVDDIRKELNNVSTNQYLKHALFTSEVYKEFIAAFDSHCPTITLNGDTVTLKSVATQIESKDRDLLVSNAEALETALSNINKLAKIDNPISRFATSLSTVKTTFDTLHSIFNSHSELKSLNTLHLKMRKVAPKYPLLGLDEFSKLHNGLITVSDLKSDTLKNSLANLQTALTNYVKVSLTSANRNPCIAFTNLKIIAKKVKQLDQSIETTKDEYLSKRSASILIYYNLFVGVWLSLIVFMITTPSSDFLNPDLGEKIDRVVNVTKEGKIEPFPPAEYMGTIALVSHIFMGFTDMFMTFVANTGSFSIVTTLIDMALRTDVTEYYPTNSSKTNYKWYKRVLIALIVIGFITFLLMAIAYVIGFNVAIFHASASSEAIFYLTFFVAQCVSALPIVFFFIAAIVLRHGIKKMFSQ